MQETLGLLAWIGSCLVILGVLLISGKIRQFRFRKTATLSLQSQEIQPEEYFYQTKEGDLRKVIVKGRYKNRLVVEFPKHKYWCMMSYSNFSRRSRRYIPGAS